MVYLRSWQNMSKGNDYLIDADADVKDLPGNDTIELGSMALSIESGKLYALTNTGWVEVA